MKFRIILLITSLLICNLSHSKITNVSYFIDSLDNWNEQSILHSPNLKLLQGQNIGFVSHYIWVVIEIDTIDKDELFLDLGNALIENITCFNQKNNNLVSQNIPFKHRALHRSTPLFRLDTFFQKTIVLKIKSNNSISISPKIISNNQVNMLTDRDLFFGCFTGVMLVMFLYNFFLYYSLKLQLYLLYCFYIFLTYVTQITFLGYAFQYLWPNIPQLNNLAIYVLPPLVVTVGINFIVQFLNIKSTHPAAFNILRTLIWGSLLSIFLSIFISKELGYGVSQATAMISALFILGFSIYLVRSDYKPARFILLGWSLFFLGVIVYILGDIGIIQNTFLTNYSMPIGAAIETVVLSLALADSINTLRKEKESANERVLEEITKNEILVRNQNVVLERKVKERTLELENTLKELKSAQSQLVQSEKMASLGVLTAGIAHEINNPINFVSANIVPLRENLQAVSNLLMAYKAVTPKNIIEQLPKILKMEEEIELDYTVQETKELLKGIEEGARRTHTIVDGLRTFSTGDSGNNRKSNLNKGIKSTISVLKSRLKHINLVVNLDPNIPQINCQVGRINQVILNLINNALDALEEKYGENSTESQITINSSLAQDHCIIEVTDNGDGISEDGLKKIFEPFFTTKDIGKGTGLGLSISYSIIEDHGGEIFADSIVGTGTTFKIKLPVT